MSQLTFRSVISICRSASSVRLQPVAGAAYAKCPLGLLSALGIRVVAIPLCSARPRSPRSTTHTLSALPARIGPIPLILWAGSGTTLRSVAFKCRQ